MQDIASCYPSVEQIDVMFGGVKKLQLHKFGKLAFLLLVVSIRKFRMQHENVAARVLDARRGLKKMPEINLL